MESSNSKTPSSGAVRHLLVAPNRPSLTVREATDAFMASNTDQIRRALS
ncbi:MAG TPA: hypothetical protein VED47_07340 [Burkholderiaceae bacterium]|nr:hypothetical protein [Burkholderiaceae bacterium]